MSIGDGRAQGTLIGDHFHWVTDIESCGGVFWGGFWALSEASKSRSSCGLASGSLRVGWTPGVSGDSHRSIGHQGGRAETGGGRLEGSGGEKNLAAG